MVDRYIPDRGDLVWLNFDPSTGREPQGRWTKSGLHLQKAMLQTRIPSLSISEKNSAKQRRLI